MPLSVIGILGFVVLFGLIFLRMPIAFAFALTGFLGTWFVRGLGPALSDMPVTIWQDISGYILVCLPLFMLMGQFANHSGIGPDLYSTALKWWGRAPGGLALTTVWGCCAFGAVTGSSTAAVLTFTPIAYQPMLDLGYDKRLASGCIICSATMAALIPPSLTFILYGAITEESIGKLFIAGIMPGLLQAAMYTGVIFLLAGLRLQAGPPGPSSSWREKIVSLKGVWGMLVIFLLVIGGIYVGLFTPTEGAAVGAAGTLVIFLARRGFNRKLLTSSVHDSLRNTSMILLIIVCSMIFAHFLSLSGLSFWLAKTVVEIGINPYAVLAAIIVLLLLAGCVMPATPMILLFVPLFYPVVVGELGFNGIWFGVIITVMTEFAVITPPVGMNLFAFKGLVKEGIETTEMWQGVMPFITADVIRVVVLVAFPIISLWLPGTMFKN